MPDDLQTPVERNSRAQTSSCGCPGPQSSSDRRDFLARSSFGLGSIALASLLQRDGFGSNLQSSSDGRANPRKIPNFAPKTTSVIFLFMTGGPSQVETFDPKPVLNTLHGQPLPDSFGQVITQQTDNKSLLLGCKRTFQKCGQSGIEVSDLFPHLRTCIDQMAVVRSIFGDSVVHAPAMYQMNSGRIQMGHPSLGS
ncbi:MAG: DUF1501 domain-containing protein, partial [Planctomycetes bacterium]|nr:DUF1501 domain-containing protein [Planctomycetota bacterium]